MPNSFLEHRASTLHTGFSVDMSLFTPRAPKFAVEFSDERARFEAENPNADQRVTLRDLGWKWDRIAQVWYAPSDDVALSAMEIFEGRTN